jgi:tRNA(Ile)-lysidine synthase
MPQLDPFERRLAESWPPCHWQDLGVLIAVSGGADSVALVRALVALKTEGAGRLWVAHFDHQLRGADSDADCQFVVELCQRLDIGCRLGRQDVRAAAQQHGDGLEAASRDARYEFLQATAEEVGARYVAAAHTADDQAETILHRIVRGTGVAGLAGIPRVRALGPATTLIRPLLDLRRTDVEQYLSRLGQPFRQDGSNLDASYTRNRIRHELLPLLADNYNPSVIDSLLRLGRLAAEAQQAIEPQVARLYSAAVTQVAASVAVACLPLAGEPRHLVREVLLLVWREQGWPLQSMGFDEWQRLAQLIAQPASAAETRQILPGNISAQKTGERLVLARL